MSNGRTPAELRAAVAAQLAAGKSLAEVKSSFAGQQLGGSIVQDVAQNRGFITPAAPPPPTAPVSRPPASSSSSSSSSSSGSSSSSSGRTTQEIRAAVQQQIAAGKSLAEVKSSFAGQKLGGSAVQDIWQKTQASSPATNTTPSSTTSSTTSSTDPFSFDVFGTPFAGGITITEFLAGQRGAELQTQSQISNYGWDAQKAIAALQQAGATERTKYEVDNKIPLLQEEARGKIDLQKIVNAGYKNIANIERGTEMVRNITSMFNF